MDELLSIIQLNSYEFKQLLDDDNFEENTYYFVYDWTKLYKYTTELARLDTINYFACEQDRLYNIDASREDVLSSFWYDISGNRLWQITKENAWTLIAGEDLDLNNFADSYMYDIAETYQRGQLTKYVSGNFSYNYND